MKKLFLITIIIAALGIGGIASAQVTAPNLWKIVSGAIRPVVSSWELGSATGRIQKGWFTNLDASNATIGSIAVSGTVSGDMVVGGQIRAANGTSTAPSYSFNSDTNTGLMWTGNDAFKFVNGGTDTLAISSAGQVKINALASSTATLIMADTLGNLYSSADNRISSATSPLILAANNLSITKASSTASGYLSNTDWSSFNGKVSSQWTTNGSNVYYTAGSVGIGTTNPISILDVNGDINNSVGWFYSNSGRGMKLRTGNNAINFYSTGDVKLRTTSADNVVYLSDPGNVGIGTTGPNDKLDVVGYTRTGPSTEKISFGGGALGFNRRVETGSIFDNTGHAYQFNHTRSTTPTSDYLALQVYNTAGGNVSSGALVVNGAGNVGIGTTVPAQKLHVNGSVQATSFLGNATTATSLAANGANCSAGYYPLGVNASGAAETCTLASTGGLSGSGTTNYISKWTGTGSQGNSVMFDDGTNVGIGTTVPGATLGVKGSKIKLVGNEGFDAFDVIDGGTGDPGYLHLFRSGVAQVTLSPDISYFNTGNVGIGTTNPQAKLQVYNSTVGGLNETIRSQGYWSSTGSGSLLRFTNYHASGLVPSAGEYNIAGIGGIDDNGNWGGALAFYVSPTGTAGGAALSEAMRIRSNGNVGIGTTGPTDKLNIAIDDASLGGLVINDKGASLGKILIGDSTLLAGAFAPTINATVVGSTISVNWMGNIAIAEDIGSAPVTAYYSYRSDGSSITTRPLFQWGTLSGYSPVVKMTMDKDGNVGIGTTAPAQKLHVNGSVQATSFLGNATTATSLAANGANCSAGYYPLGVNASGAAETCTLASTGSVSGSGTTNYISKWTGTGSQGNSVMFDNGTNVGIGTTGPLNKLDIYYDSATYNPAAYNISGVTLRTAAATGDFSGIRFTASGARESFFGVVEGPSSNKSNFVFQGYDGTSLSYKEFMRINDTGNVGIGTTGPDRLLHLQAAEPWIKLHGTTAGGKYLIGSADGSLVFYDEVSWLPRMIIQSDGDVIVNNGNVGIGTTAPAQKLHVNGSVQATSFLGNASTATALQTARTIDGTSFNGTADIKTTEWYHSNRDFADGTIITTSINYAVSSGDPWILEIKGNSYGSGVPFDIQYQGYIYSDTVINHGGYSNGTNLTGLVLLNVGGNLTFWFPRQAYWQGFNVRVYTAYGTYALNKVTSITNGVKPTGTKEVALSASIRQSLHSSNYNSYAPTLTGTGASGNWAINATTATSLAANGANCSAGYYPLGVNASGAAETCTLASTGSVSGSGTTNYISKWTGTSSQGNSVIFDNGANVGIGTVSPTRRLHIEGSAAVGAVGTEPILVLGRALSSGISFQQSASFNLGRYAVPGGSFESYSRLDIALRDNESASNYNTNATVMTLQSNGNVGISTVSPGYKLDVNGTVRVSGLLTASSGIDMMGTNIGNVNKLYVDTIDPLYNIDGVNYATYAASVSGGVKEEYIGKAYLNKKNPLTGEFEKTIDFNKVEIASDIWLWRQVVDFSKNNVDVLISPYGKQASVYYLIDGEKLIFRADKSVEISYRLTGRRFDWTDHPTILIDAPFTGRKVR